MTGAKMESQRERVPGDGSDINRREFLHSTLATAAAFAVTPQLAFLSGSSKDEVLAQIPLQHDQTVKMLRDWIAVPSIAAENLGYPRGAEYMASLARDAGFQRVEIVPTSGKPGVFGILDAGAKSWLGIYFMYDVKQYDPAEWSSPPLEGRIVERPGDRKSTRLNSSHLVISYAVFCLNEQRD